MRGSASGKLGREQQATGGAVRRNQMSQGGAEDNISVQKQREGCMQKEKRAAARERNQDRFHVEGRSQLCPHWQGAPVSRHPGGAAG